MLKKVCFAGIVFCLLTFSGVGNAEEGFVTLFNGQDLQGWVGRTDLYEVKERELRFREGKKNYGNLMYHRKFRDFVLRFEFQLVPNGNNGLAIRASDIHKDAAYYGMELQILDDTGSLKQNLEPYQYHGSIYGVVAAKKGFLKPVGEWNVQEVRAVGSRITVTLNGTIILDTDIANIRETPDGKEHPGLHNAEGYIGFLGHTMPVKFRNIRIKEL
ncbi:MAG: DUF1080 domain-containing protein [Planctomycetia bacterium]|nr:DUF1080 domain-containing protein [Planctomycetia bacterium]